jgi:hypothetical protein
MALGGHGCALAPAVQHNASPIAALIILVLAILVTVGSGVVIARRINRRGI